MSSTPPTLSSTGLSPVVVGQIESVREKITNWGHAAIVWLGIAAFVIAVIVDALAASGAHVPTGVTNFLGTVGIAIAAASKGIDSANAAITRR